MKKRKEKGITLIALIITIIVLLILAGVAISLTIGENGILTKTQNARVEYSEAEIQEKMKMAYAALKMEEGNNPNVDKTAYLKSKLEEQDLNGVEVISAADSWIITYEGKDYQLSNSGILEEAKIIDWDTVIANAQKHPEQSATNNEIGIDMYGNPVNMDLWRIELNNSNNQFTLTTGIGCTKTSGYIGPITAEGKIIGEIPQYLKTNGKTYTLESLAYTFKGLSDLVIAPRIPNTVTSMACSFEGCTSLTVAPVIPKTVTNIAAIFEGCTSLVMAPEIPDSVTSLGGAFCGCSSLTQAPKIPENITEINSLFSGCSSLTTVPKIPNNVTNLNNTFNSCTSLIQAPEIPNTVTDMGYAFSNCTSLTQAPTVPSSVTNLDRAFGDCRALTGNLVINSTNVTNYQGCFLDTARNEGCNLVVSGSCPQLDQIIETATLRDQYGYGTNIRNPNVTKGN